MALGRNVLLFGLVCLMTLFLLAGCGPTLRLSPAGWKQDNATYAISARPDGRRMPPGWRLENFEPAGDGFRKRSDDDARDFEFRRSEDDGVLVVATESLAADSLQKKPEGLAARWLDVVVIDPHRGDDGVKSLDGRGGLYDAMLPPRRDVAILALNSGLTAATVREAGRFPQVTRRADILVANGEGSELEADLVARGAPGPDRSLYLAILRPTSRGRMVVVAYSNAPTSFPTGARDASDLAHRIRF
jgi:hypothetical protein